MSENFTYDESKKANPFRSEFDDAEQFRAMYEERELMVHELTEQLTRRVKEHLILKERKVSDFAKPIRSETSIFESQVEGHERVANSLQRQVDAQNQDA